MQQKNFTFEIKTDMDNEIYLLWTNGNLITAKEMIFMYAINSRLNGWWEKITLIIWGNATLLVKENIELQDLVKEAIEHGVHVSACKKCSDDLGASATLESIGVEVKYWGQSLTKLLKDGKKILTI
jgi:hypothetical protein